jgi:cysteine sulfinate desulfinase/cysteine desulfurase-like protein
MIYLDYNATTPVLPEVLNAMLPYLTSEWCSFPLAQPPQPIFEQMVY